MDSRFSGINAQDSSTDCCIVGGGPAGMMLGYLLARAGVAVTVLEKWGDFFRDFRGDTIHPSTLEVLKELNILDDFLKLPHHKTSMLAADIAGELTPIADFSHLPVSCPYIAFTPQWDFLNFIAKNAATLPTFKLLMNTSGIDLIREGNKITGVIAKTDEQTFTIQSQLVVAADGRHSTIREKSGLALRDLGAPMDVLWFRISKKSSDPDYSLGKIKPGHMMVMIDRGDYWQCGFVIRKGYFDAIKSKGLAAFQKDVIETAPVLADRITELSDWTSIKLLQVSVNRLEKWYLPGLLCIGDAAHAMSPVGGVGVNLAIQDAVATANLLIDPLRKKNILEKDLAKVQKRREKPAKITQRIQIFIQNRVIGNVLNTKTETLKAPFAIKLLGWFPMLRRLPARMIGLGVLPEHIER